MYGSIAHKVLFTALLFFGAFLFVLGAQAAEHCSELTAVNINTAPQEDLECIAHIGPSRASQIIELRGQEPFSSVDGLERVSGIGGPGSATLEDIKAQGLATVEETQSEAESQEEPEDEDQQDSSTADTSTNETTCVDINTAPASELEKLTGVGEVTAERIIAERPFASLDDLTQVNGIGEVTLAGIKEQGLACVDGISSLPPASGVEGVVDSVTPPRIGSDVVAGTGDAVVFSVESPAESISYTWYLGDGTLQRGAQVTHAYRFPGTYVVTLEAEGASRSVIAQKRAYIFGGGVVINEIYVPAGGEQGWVELFNAGSSAVNMGGWSIRMGETAFSLPKHTTIAPYTFLTLPAQVTGLAPQTADVVELFYPNGARADEIAFGALRPGRAVARLDTSFYWTTTPTPGGVNSVFSPPATLGYSDTLPYVEESEPPAGTSTVPVQKAEVEEDDPKTAFTAEILQNIDEDRFSLPVSGAAAGAGAFSLLAGVGYVLFRRRIG